ncbi:MAG: NAD-dependent DNA ligase LigA [Erysipelotrichaceae bacterium]|nr:NAD-dependent DNA ligase LigA [Erysipelotrichaceae bacterium]
MANNLARMKELIEKIKEADTAYFTNDDPIMSDREYDALVEELKKLEQESGVTFATSPTRNVSGEVKKGLQSVPHSKPMLSAEKTKDIADIQKFALEHDTVFSWKLDGLTLVLRYEKGRFVQALTRGSEGLVGEDVTHTVRHIRNIPQRVSCRESFEVRGEGLLSWSDYNVLSSRMAEQAHPRTIAAGTVRSLNADTGKLSHLDFLAFELICDWENQPVRKSEQLSWLASQGFAVVPHVFVSAYSGEQRITETVRSYDPESYEYPVDGVMAEYDDLAYGRSMGATGHHENNKLALKWQDELYETVFRGADLITTRTGAVSIVANFDPVLVDGSYIKRANMHNLGIFEKFKLGIGDKIRVYRANMIIPQVAENITQSGTYRLSEYCPCCGEKLTVRYSSGGVKELFCPNEQCIARNAQKIARYCDKSAMNIDGLSAVTLEKLMAYGWVKNYADLYHLEDHREEIANTRGFGIASFEKMRTAIEKSRSCRLSGFLMGMGIQNLGPQAARILDQYYYGSWDNFEEALNENFAFSHIEGISSALQQSIYSWYNDENNRKLLKPLIKELNFGVRGVAREGSDNRTSLCDANVVVTGTLSNMTRKQVTEVLTLMGASVSESVSHNTDILIVGAMPGGKKLGAAMAMGTKIITESQLAEMLASD